MSNTKREQLYQLWAEETKTGKLVPVPMFPRMCKEAVDGFAETMRTMIAAGKVRNYTNPQVLAHISTFN